MAQWIRHRSTEPEIVGSSPTRVSYCPILWRCVDAVGEIEYKSAKGISGLVVEYIVAIDVTRVRFPADARVVIYLWLSKGCKTSPRVNRQALQKKTNSGHPESNQGPSDVCWIYSQMLYQLSYSRLATKTYRYISNPRGETPSA